MRSKALASLLIIALAAAMVGGATMAWFTDVKAGEAAVFEAGTLKISTTGGKIPIHNWNPGDCSELNFCVTNIGSKRAKIRAQLNSFWTPGKYRMLVLYRDEAIQIIGIEWDSTCVICLGTGPIATGTVTLTPHLTSADANKPYVTVRFGSDLTPQPYLQAGVPYPGWCLDIEESLPLVTRVWQVYDPFCDPLWYTRLGLSAEKQALFANIPWFKLNYIINQDYLSQGYSGRQIQQAFYRLINGRFRSGANWSAGVPGAQEILADMEAAVAVISSTDNVTLQAGEQWEYIDGYWYYTGIVNSGQKVCLNLKVCLDGPSTGNHFQKAEYRIYSRFEAIQASHDDQWEWDGVDFVTGLPF